MRFQQIRPIQPPGEDARRPGQRRPEVLSIEAVVQFRRGFGGQAVPGLPNLRTPVAPVGPGRFAARRVPPFQAAANLSGMAAGDGEQRSGQIRSILSELEAEVC